MRYAKILTYLVPVLALGACDDDGLTEPQEFGPAAVIRIANVVTDRGTIDFRFQDRVENLPSLLGVQFRGYSGLYQRTHAGARPLRVFPTSTDPAVAQTILQDETVNLTDGGRYTFVYSGEIGAGEDDLLMFEEPAIPSPAGLAIKVLNGAHGLGNLDVYVVPFTEAADTLPNPSDWETNNAGVITNVAYGTQTGYVDVAAAASGFYRFVVTAAGSNTPLYTYTPNVAGAAAPSGASYGPQPGVRIAGSVMTLVLSSGTVPGSPGSTAANQQPGGIVMIDKALNP